MTRIQWINPTVARMLILCDYETIDDVASAVPEVLFDGLSKINDKHRFYKGKLACEISSGIVNAAAFLDKHSCNKGLHGTPCPSAAPMKPSVS